MRKLNDIAFFMITLFIVESNPEGHLFRGILAISFLIFALTYFAGKLARKTSKKKLIGGEKISIA